MDTFGSREYADAVVRLLDPSGDLFSGRVISRKDTVHAATAAAASASAPSGGGGSPATTKAHSWLHRSLGDHSMVLIVDDTEAVWPGARNLVLIEPYIFWRVGPGFEANNAAGASPLAIVGGQHAPSSVVASLLPPTAPAAAAATPDLPTTTVGPGGAPASVPPLPAATPAPLWIEEAAPVLQRDILRVLRAVHAEYFAQIDAAAVAVHPKTNAPLPLPRTDVILTEVMRSILNGTAVLFSGVFPTNVDASRQPIVRRALTFGAAVVDVPPRPPASAVTHVVAQRAGTAKVQSAATSGGVRIVHVDWLAACLRQYRRLPEAAFPLAIGHERFTSVDVSRAERDLAQWRATLVERGEARPAGSGAGSGSAHDPLALAGGGTASDSVSQHHSLAGRKRRLKMAGVDDGSFGSAASTEEEGEGRDASEALSSGMVASADLAGGVDGDDPEPLDAQADESGSDDSLEAELLAALLEQEQPKTED